VSAPSRWRAGASRLALPAAIFVGSFSWSFVFVSLPFHIQHISTWDPTSTLRWTGWILGVTALVTVATAPLWGRVGGRGDPKRLFMIVQALQGLGFFGMAVARTLPELFVSRIVLGFMGAVSTFAFIIAGRAGDPREVRRQVGAAQSAMTVGQVIGPLVGAIAAARLGFRASCVVGGLILCAGAGLVGWGVPDPPKHEGSSTTMGTASLHEVTAVVVLILGASIQIFFLPSILPQILPPMGVAAGDMLEIGGVLIFVSGVAAAGGSLLAPRLAEVFPRRWLLASLLTASGVCAAGLALASSVAVFGALRFLQVMFIAPVFPIAVASIAHRAGGQAIGAINAARIGAAFIGPVLATTVLAVGPPAVLYLVLTAVALASVPVATWRGRAPMGGR
jgi:MFS transporter, DHA1 family, multidrug resistance protein